MKKIKTGYYLIGAFVVLIGLLIAMNIINDNQERYLQENGIEVLATITDIDVNNYKANELEGTYVENYILTFQFSDSDGKVVTNVRTVEKKDFKLYFDKTLNVNDQIKIVYDESDSSKNTFKELPK